MGVYADRQRFQVLRDLLQKYSVQADARHGDSVDEALRNIDTLLQRLQTLSELEDANSAQ